MLYEGPHSSRGNKIKYPKTNRGETGGLRESRKVYVLKGETEAGTPSESEFNYRGVVTPSLRPSFN